MTKRHCRPMTPSSEGPNGGRPNPEKVGGLTVTGPRGWGHKGWGQLVQSQPQIPQFYPLKPNAKSGWSMGSTRGHNSTNRALARKERHWERQREKARNFERDLLRPWPTRGQSQIDRHVNQFCTDFFLLFLGVPNWRVGPRGRGDPKGGTFFFRESGVWGRGLCGGEREGSLGEHQHRQTCAEQKTIKKRNRQKNKQNQNTF